MAWSPYMTARELTRVFGISADQLLRIAHQGRARVDAALVSIAAVNRQEVRVLAAECDAAWRLIVEADAGTESAGEVYTTVYLLLVDAGLLAQPRF